MSGPYYINFLGLLQLFYIQIREHDQRHTTKTDQRNRRSNTILNYTTTMQLIPSDFVVLCNLEITSPKSVTCM